jgi:hypothetical protein
LLSYFGLAAEEAPKPLTLMGFHAIVYPSAALAAQGDWQARSDRSLLADLRDRIFTMQQRCRTPTKQGRWVDEKPPNRGL